MATVAHNVIIQETSLYQATFHFGGDRGDVTRKYVKNAFKGSGIVHDCSNLTSTPKGVADYFALVGRTAKFATPYVPKGVSDWTNNLSSLAVKTRGALCLPFLWTVVKRFQKEINFRSIFELLATASHAAALLILGAVSKIMNIAGNIFKVFVDSYDFYDNSKKILVTRELCKIANENDISEEVKSGLNSQWYTQVYRIGRYSLAAIVGFATNLAVLAAITLPAGLAVGLLAMSVVSAIFAIMAEHSMYSSDYVEPRI